MTFKVKTAEEFNSLSFEEKVAIGNEVIDGEHCRDPRGVIEMEEFFEISAKMLSENERVEKVAYAITDFMRANPEAFETAIDEDSVNEAVHEFMSETADWVDKEYCGDYFSHEDGFWVPSYC